MSEKKKKFMRRKKWVRADLQLSHILSLVVFCGLTLTLHAVLCYVGLERVRETVEGPQARAIDAVRDVLSASYGWALATGVFFAIAVGVARSFKYSGPIHRINRFMKEVQEGRWGQNCDLRRGDLLQDVKDNANDAVTSLTDFIQEQQVLLESAQKYLNTCYASQDTVKVSNRIDELKGELSRRMGQSNESDAAGDPDDTEETKAEDKKQELTEA